jgi:hypothetical protein
VALDAEVLFRLISFALVAAVTASVALLLLAANPRRNWNQWLAFFVLLVAGNFAFQALGPAVGSPQDVVLQRLAFLLLIFDPAVLAYFASLFPRRTALAERRWGVPLLAAPVLAFTVLEVGFRAVWPSDSIILRIAFFAYLGACYTYAGWRLLANFLAERSSVMAHQVRAVTLGLLIAGFSRVALIPNDVNSVLTPLGGLSPLAEFGLRVAALAGLALAARRWVLRSPASEARRQDARGMLRVAVGVYAVFVAVWALDLLPTLALPPAEGVHWRFTVGNFANALTFSIRWFVFSAAILVGIVRFEIMAVRPAAAAVPGVAVAALGLTLVVAFGESALAPWALALLATGLLLLAVGSVYVPLARARSPTRGSEYLHARRLEVYRAALAAALAAGPLTPARAEELERVRDQLGVSQREHETMLAMAQAEESRGAPRQVLLGRYEVLRRLGAGGYATVYLANDRAGHELVALKHVRQDAVGDRAALDAAAREFEVARRASHPNLVAVHDMQRVDDGVVIVMEYADHGSLRDRLAEQGKLGPAEAASLLRDALLGLQALHEAGIVHGDLKPENILLGGDGRAKLADFGAARAFQPRQTLVQATRSRAAPATLQYMAPECAAGQRPSPAADLYALGAIGYELLTGRPHVDAEGLGPYEVLRRIVDGPPGPRAPMPAGWEPYLGRALRPKPAERYVSAAEMLGALDALEVGGRERGLTPKGAPRRRPGAA